MSTYQDRTGTEVAVQFQKPRLPYDPRVGERLGIDRPGWKVLVEAIFPLAKSPDAIVLALSYCKARGLDIFKKPVHIVPMWDAQKKSYIDTIWPSIAELRITAHRTGEYGGCDETEFGPEVTREFSGEVVDWENGNKTKKIIKKTVSFPEWARVTVYRFHNGTMLKFVGPRVKWLESYAAMGKSDVPNEMWESRPDGQLEKCAEAGAIRKAFPEETGNTYTAEEMQGKSLPLELTAVTQDPTPPQLSAVKRKTLDDIAAGPTALQQSAPPSEEMEKHPPQQEQETALGTPTAERAYTDGRTAFAAGLTSRAIPVQYKRYRLLNEAWLNGLADAAMENAKAEDQGASYE